jgi:hypothetical protein
MKAPSDGWDSDEREALASDELARQLAAAQARHTLGAGGRSAHPRQGSTRRA